mmetsp:Transcript_62857/g.198507  ORF Transcript_62857/g.198507 Transcript_62857/m.198507 type:complete len:221 (-) Transcript_62857:267-929(-)
MAALRPMALGLRPAACIAKRSSMALDQPAALSHVARAVLHVTRLASSPDPRIPMRPARSPSAPFQVEPASHAAAAAFNATTSGSGPQRHMPERRANAWGHCCPALDAVSAAPWARTSGSAVLQRASKRRLNAEAQSAALPHVQTTEFQSVADRRRPSRRTSVQSPRALLQAPLALSRALITELQVISFGRTPLACMSARADRAPSQEPARWRAATWRVKM